MTKRKRLTRYNPYIPPAAVLSVFLFYGLVYLGADYRNSYVEREERILKLQKEELAQKERDVELRAELRDRELEDLRRQLEELKNKPAETQQAPAEVAPADEEDDIVAIVKKWSPRVAHIKCVWYNSDGTIKGTASGSSTLVNFSYLGIKAVTSRHLFYRSPDQSLPKECVITPTDSKAYTVEINKTSVSIGEKEDWAYVALPKDETLAGITKENVRLCGSVETGDRLLILGYPKIGAKVGLTVTDGILSGDDGDYYITSAKIDKGNSGGAAILVKDNCYLGIPSASVVGTIESLGRILKARFVLGN